MNSGLIAHNERVLVLFVLEEIEDSVLFHEARNKIKVGFAVLHAVFTLLELTLRRILEISEAAILKDLRDDVRDGHVLKNAAIGPSGEKPEPGDDFSVVVRESFVHSGLCEEADVAVEIAFAAIGKSKGNADLLSDDFRKINGGIFGNQLGGDPEKAGNAFVSGKAHEEKYVFPQRRFDGDDSIFLRIWHIPRVPSLRSRCLPENCLSEPETFKKLVRIRFHQAFRYIQKIILRGSSRQVAHVEVASGQAGIPRLPKGRASEYRQFFTSLQANAPQLFDIAKIVADRQNGLQFLSDAIRTIAIAKSVSSALVKNLQKERFGKPPASERIVTLAIAACLVEDPRVSEGSCA